MDSATSFLEIPSSFLQILTSTSLIIVAVYLPFSHFASRLSTRIRRGWNMREGEGGMSAGHRNNDAKRSWRALRLPKTHDLRPATHCARRAILAAQPLLWTRRRTAPPSTLTSTSAQVRPAKASSHGVADVVRISSNAQSSHGARGASRSGRSGGCRESDRDVTFFSPQRLP